MDSDDQWWTIDFDSEEFAREVARLCKLLIRARDRCDGFYDSAVYGDWGVDSDDKRFTVSWMLGNAAHLLARINTEFLPRCGTGGIPLLTDDTPLHRLAGEIAFFVPPSGGGPLHNATLVEYARLAEEGKDIPWDESIQWDSLAAIRKELDQLSIGSQCDGKSTGEATGAAWYHTTPPIDEHKWPCPVKNESGEHCEFTQDQLCQFLDIRQPKTLKTHAQQQRFYVYKRKKAHYSIWFRTGEERSKFNQRRQKLKVTGT